MGKVRGYCKPPVVMHNWYCETGVLEWSAGVYWVYGKKGGDIGIIPMEIL